MPTYVYEVIDDKGQSGEQFEVIQKMSDEPLTTHPETGQPVRRVIVAFHVAGSHGSNPERALADDKKLERMGFTKYVKSDDGKYDKVVGKGPDKIKR